MILILMGKSASGKDTILKKLHKKYCYKPIVSDTSRPMRVKETDGIDYNFISKQQFLNKIAGNKYIEHRSYVTKVANKEDVWYYGIPKFELNESMNYVVILDLQGTIDFVEYFGKHNCFIVLIEADDSVREKRARQRGSFNITEWLRRLEDDNEKFENAERYVDLKIKNNGDVSLEYIIIQINREI